MKALLVPFEQLYRGVNSLRRRLYERGVLRQKRLPRPVISIGNLSMGGSGKTPLTIAVARHLHEHGYRVAILSRGYGRENPGRIAVVDSTDPSAFGDEPVLLAKQLPFARVVVGGNRHSAGEWLLRHHDTDVFLLDDGFQHLRLARNIDIVIADPAARWLREGPGALRSASIVVERVRDNGRPFAVPAAVQHVHRANLQPSAVLVDGKRLPVDTLRGRSVVAFSALANNDQFFSLLTSLGANVESCISFPDHHRYADADLAHLESSKEQAGADWLVTTAKDAVKIESARVAVLEVEMALPPAFFDHLDRILESPQ